ncbi:DUF459 domain-containing protein [bacterium]|nr:DUF459 domain-containing protein [bacterium]
MAGKEITTGKLLGAGWAILLALLLVFAHDVSQWAVASESAAVQTAVTPAAGWLDAVATGTGITPARQALAEAVHGFYGSQRILAARTAPSVPEPVKVAVTAPVEPEIITPVVAAAQTPAKFKPTRVLIVGDSSIQSGLGTDLERLIETYEGITVMRFGQHSTGLARPDYFDWNVKLTELMDEFAPDMVIGYWGDNDCQGLSTPEGEFIAHFGTDEWDAEYGLRVQHIVELVKERGGEAVLIGMPIMRAKSFSKRIERLNGVVETAVDAAGGFFLPTWDMCADADGKYMASVEFEGQTRIIRQGDGIHLSSHGAKYVADGICKILEEHYDMHRTADAAETD